MRALAAITLSLPLVLTLLLERVTEPAGDPDHSTDAAIRRIDEITQARRSTATAVLEGRITLAQAAASFQQLSDQQPPEFLECMGANYFPLASRDELHFRHVLCYAEVESAETPDATRKAAIERLRREMQQREKDNRWQ